MWEILDRLIKKVACPSKPISSEVFYGRKEVGEPFNLEKHLFWECKCIQNEVWDPKCRGCPYSPRPRSPHTQFTD